MAHHVSVFDLTASLSEAIDLVSPRVAGHNLQTAYIAYALAREMGLGEPETVQLVLASCLHDVGGLSLQDRLDALVFDAADNAHGETGAALLSLFPPFVPLARIIRFHHDPWSAWHDPDAMLREPDLRDGERLSRSILYLADRIDVSLQPGVSPALQAAAIVSQIEGAGAGRFNPDAVGAFRAVAARREFWNALQDGSYHEMLACGVSYPTMRVAGSELEAMFSLFGRIVDFRSPYTASHSAAVAACVARLGAACGLTSDEARLLRMAGSLHDIGKLAVPRELLEKDAPLTKGEYRIIRDHPYQSGSVLRHLKAFPQLRIWVSQHHERMNGNGYPCHVRGEALSFGSRLLAVADVFVALTEDRPYRPGMNLGLAVRTMEAMDREHSFDTDVMAVLHDMRTELDAVRMEVQHQELGTYSRFTQHQPQPSS